MRTLEKICLIMKKDTIVVFYVYTSCSSAEEEGGERGGGGLSMALDIIRVGYGRLQVMTSQYPTLHFFILSEINGTVSRN